jgi:hypothetical protein
MPSPLDPDVVEKARQLRRKGDSLTAIQRALGISYGSAHRFTKGICPEKARSPEVRGKIAAAKETAHAKWVRDAPRGECDTPGCDRPGCRIPYGKCHCGCGEDAPIATDDDRTRKYVRGEPRLYTRRCQRSADTLMAADNGEPLLNALELADLSRIEVTRRAKPKLGKGVVADLVGLDGYRLSRERCERIVVVLRAAFEEKGLDSTGLPLERLFTYERSPNEPPVGERARRVERRRPPTPPNKRGDGRHFKADAERLRDFCEKESLVTHERAADEILLLPRSTLSYFRERGRIEGRRIRVGALTATVYDLRALRQLGLTLRKSQAAWDRRRRDPVAIFDRRRGLGASRDEARHHADRITEQLKAWGRTRVGTGRPKSAGPPAHHIAWAKRFVEITTELEERYAVDIANGFDDPAPTKWEVALLVAYEDFDAHPDRWEYSPEDFPREAASRVWRAIKPLLIALPETRIA